jgi:ATP-dependent helicase HrpA
VVIVAGETGSGKTTQLPKILLELGRGRVGQIGHTQPRRIAARTVAERIAAELGTPLGEVVGYQVRFTDESTESTLVKVMTDGILLAEIQRDPMLWAYDSIIVDEAHERSLNIDFLLGYLTRLLPMRPDLKVIITSATIDSELFARHFAHDGVPAPVIQVTGRTYPVEVRYRPADTDASATDQPAAIVAAARELMQDGLGDILVFCSGEREIRDAADALVDDLGAVIVTGKGHAAGGRAAGASAPAGKSRAAATPRTGAPAPEVLPLYARLSAAEQHRVFEPHTARRIVLATNIAETSLTVPGIHYVIDPGTARISRYSKATKVQRLPIEPISQASANQRAGRCGRIANGVCIRLYAQDDFAARPEYTEPEILRTSLASVILRMIAVGVAASPADIVSFPFVQPPDPRGVRDGIALLTELGAIASADAGPHLGHSGSDPSGETADSTTPSERNSEPLAITSRGARRPTHTTLTDVGRTMAEIPVDPRLARMIVEAGRLGVVREMTILAAALSIQDVRERPLEYRDEADRAHARFADPTSDFLTYLNLWDYLREARREQSSSAFRRTVRAEFLNYLRIREWQDLVTQLRRIVKPLGLIPAPRGTTIALPDRETSAPRSDTHIGPPGPQSRPSRGAAHGSPQTGADPATPLPRPDAPTDPAGYGRPSSRGMQRTAPQTSAPATTPASFRLEWDAQAIHRALLAGLLSQLGMRADTDVGAKPPPTRTPTGQPRRTRRTARNDYLGARGTRFAIFPGSPLAASPPGWIMAAELVETSRLWARDVAGLDPAWAEEVAGDLVRRIYSEPRWSARRGAAIVTEKVMLYGLTIIPGRPVPLAHTDRVLARELFIRHALVEGEWQTRHQFFHTNRELLDQADRLVHRTRDRSLSVDPEDLLAFYDQRIPASVTSVRHFDAWWRKVRQRTPELLTLTPDAIGLGAEPLACDGFPDIWTAGEFRLPVTYEFTPGSPEDGATVHIPIEIANQIPRDGFDWQVLGLRTELVAALIKSLPKKDRVHLVPAPDTARAAVARLGDMDQWRDVAGHIRPLTEALGVVFREMRDVIVPADAWNYDRVPDHLRLRFAVVNARGEAMATGLDVAAVIHEADPGIREAIAAVVKASGVDVTSRPPDDAGPSPSLSGAPAAVGWVGERDRVDTWDFGDLPTEVRLDAGHGVWVRGYPALVVEEGGGDPVDARAVGAGGGVSGDGAGGPRTGDGGRGGAGACAGGRSYAGGLGVGGTVAVRLVTDAARAAQAHPLGVRALLLGELRLPVGRVTSRLADPAKLALASWRGGRMDALIEDIQAAAVDGLVAEHGGVPRTQGGYAIVRERLLHRLEDRIYRIALAVANLLREVHRVEVRLEDVTEMAVLNSATDIRRHVDSLVVQGFVARAGEARLAWLRRYVAADAYRLEHVGTTRAREQKGIWTVEQMWEAYRTAVAELPAGAVESAALVEVEWMIEELRVSLFAQQIGTAYPVSEQRIRKAIAAATARPA